MGGYIGSSVGNVANAAERKQTYSITTATTSLTGLAYTPTKVHVFHNGVRLVDSTDYTATNGTSITLTNAAQNGDEVVVISYPSFQTSDTVSAANGGTFAGNIAMSGTLGVTGATTLSGGVSGNILPSADNTSDLGSASKRFNELYVGGGVVFDAVAGNATSNTLDDYEEGVYTYTITGDSSGSWTVRSGYTTASYTKIGRMVTVTGQFETQGTKTASGQAQISLPFTCASGGQFGSSSGLPVRNNGSTVAGTKFAFLSNNQAFFYIANIADDGSLSLMDDSNLDASFEFKLSITYFTS
tara:strand:+ start:49 stop:945 length:897 start_codon:yes stop_codon:yes gene_type:complete